MKPHPRIRKTIKWGGAAVTVLLVAASIGSGWYEMCFMGKGWWVFVGSGRIGYHRTSDSWVAAPSVASLDYPFPTNEGLTLSRLAYPRFYWQTNVGSGIAARWVAVPMWPLCLLALGAAGFAWRLDTLARRRTRLNLCPKCTYDRTGLAANARCPECGTLPKP